MENIVILIIQFYRVVLHMLSYDVITCVCFYVESLCCGSSFELRIYTTHSCVVRQSTLYQDLVKTISRASAL